MKKYNYIVSVVMLLLSGYIFYESSGYTIGSCLLYTSDAADD
mgnify:CR=1 FL=1